MKKTNKKIEAKYCPHCSDKITVDVDGETEVFECENCKFVEKKRKKS